MSDNEHTPVHTPPNDSPEQSEDEEVEDIAAPGVAPAPVVAAVVGPGAAPAPGLPAPHFAPAGVAIAAAAAAAPPVLVKSPSVVADPKADGWLYVWRASGFTVQVATDAEILVALGVAVVPANLIAGRNAYNAWVNATNRRVEILVGGKAATGKAHLPDRGLGATGSGLVRPRLQAEKNAYDRLCHGNAVGNGVQVPINGQLLVQMRAQMQGPPPGLVDFGGVTFVRGQTADDQEICDSENFLLDILGIKLPSRFLKDLRDVVQPIIGETIANGNLKPSEVVLADTAVLDLVRADFINGNNDGFSFASLVQSLSGDYLLLADVPLIISVPNAAIPLAQRRRFIKLALRVRN